METAHYKTLTHLSLKPVVEYGSTASIAERTFFKQRQRQRNLRKQDKDVERTVFCNRGRTYVFVKGKDGAVNKILPDHQPDHSEEPGAMDNQSLYIERVLKFTSDEVNEIRRLGAKYWELGSLVDYEEFMDQACSFFKHNGPVEYIQGIAFEELFRKGQVMGVLLRYEVTVEMLDLNPDGIYIEELGIAVCRTALMGVHPLSPKGRLINDLRLHGEGHGTGVSIHINDPDRELSPRFVNIANVVHEVKFRYELTTPPGMYLYFNQNPKFLGRELESYKHGGGRFFVPLEELANITFLYDNREQARNHGSESVTLSSHKLEVEQIKRDSARDKAQDEARLREYEYQLRRENAELERLKSDNDRLTIQEKRRMSEANAKQQNIKSFIGFSELLSTVIILIKTVIVAKGKEVAKEKGKKAAFGLFGKLLGAFR